MEQQVLGGRYLLRDKIGTGGMATVYRAQDQVLDRTVAVKIMLPQYAADATFAARFKQEAQAAAGLSSPYIVSVYDWGKDGDTYYIVMEYLRGTDLKSGIRSHGALDPKKVAQIGSQICGALAVAHKHEIIHRDIKPQNIMVLPDGNIKVMDFGIARAKNSHLTQDNNVLGTAHYVSPEQTRGQELGPTSDLYSLGVVMYECATGQVPFDGDDAISVALKQVNELPVPPSELNPNVDPDLERIILKCMEKDPANRFQSANELRQVLNTYLSGRRVDVPEPTRVLSTPLNATSAETRVMEQERTTVRPAIMTEQPSQKRGRPAATDSYTPPQKSNRNKIIAGVVAAVAIIAVVVAVFASGILGGGADTVTVPNVIGSTQQEAEQALESEGLEVGRVTRSFNSEYEEGQVCDQSPSGGRTASKGDTVDITISRGEEPVEQVSVPSLIGKTADEAAKALSDAGLVGNPTQEENDADEGTVFDQSPSAGEQIDAGSTVTYKVSTGPDTITVPDVTGYDQATAQNMLGEENLSYTVTNSYNDMAAGTVFDYSPKGDVAPGTTITLSVSLGPEPTKTASVPNVTGWTESEAKSAIENTGFATSITEQTSSSVPAGLVISYSPSGTQELGTTVVLVVSKGSGSTSSGSTSSGGSTSGGSTSGGGTSSNNGGSSSGGTSSSTTSD